MKPPENIIEALIARHNKHTTMMRDNYDNAFALDEHFNLAIEIEYCINDITNPNSSYRLWFYEKTTNADYLYTKLKKLAIEATEEYLKNIRSIK
jgi:hypothetical protein